MTGTGFLADPGAVIAGIVGDAEPSLGRDVIVAAITRAAPSRAQQRRLAAALGEDPGLLTSGRPEGPPQVELLVRELLPAGARQLVLPRCAHCGEPRRLVQCDGSLRICTACDRDLAGTVSGAPDLLRGHPAQGGQVGPLVVVPLQGLQVQENRGAVVPRGLEQRRGDQVPDPADGQQVLGGE